MFYIDDNGNVHMTAGVIEWDNLINRPQIMNVVGLREEIDEFKSDVDRCLGTRITSSSIISPYIGGGYLHISNGVDAVTIDPKGISGATNAIFQVTHYGSAVMEITRGGSGYFNGRISSDSGNIGGWLIDSSGLISAGQRGQSYIYPEQVYLSFNGSTTSINGGEMDTEELTVSRYLYASKIHDGSMIELETPLVKVTELDAGHLETMTLNARSWAAIQSGLTVSGRIESYSGLTICNGSLQAGPTHVLSSVIGNSTHDIDANVCITPGGFLCTSSSSSRRYKENITTDLSGLLDPEKLYNIDVVQFQYKPGYITKKSYRPTDLVIGFIAEDIDEKYPVAATYLSDGVPESWNVKMIVPPMLALVQNHYKELNIHRSKIEALENRLESMEYKLQQAFEKIAVYDKIIAL